MSWDAIGDAIQAAIARASGGSTVIWKHQDRSAPLLDYVAISLGGMLTLGIDYLQTSFDDTRPRGQEVQLLVRGRREVPLEIECFTNQAVSGRQGAATVLCSTILAGLLLPSVRQMFTDAGVSPFDPGTVNWIPDVPSTKFRGRAVATVRCYMPPPTVAEYVGYIERVSGDVTVQGGAGGDRTEPFDSAQTAPGDEDPQ